MNLGCNCVHKVKDMQFIKCKLYFILLIRMFSALQSTLLQPWSDRRPQSQSCFMNADFSRHSEDMRWIFVALSGKGRIQGALCFSTTHKSIDCASELWQLHVNMSGAKETTVTTVTLVTVCYCFLSALVVIVSSCSDEEFPCTSGECISAALRCNFKTDCENGSDEEFCGICIYILGSIFKMSDSQPLLLKCSSEFCLLFSFFFFLFKRLMHIWGSHLWLEGHQWCVLPLAEGNGKHHLTTWCGPHLRKSNR